MAITLTMHAFLIQHIYEMGSILGMRSNDPKEKLVMYLKYHYPAMVATYSCIVGAVRDFFLPFGSHSSKSTKIDPDVVHTILFRFLTGAEMGDFRGRHFGQIQYGRYLGY